MQPTPTTDLKALTGLRFIAAFYVLAFHGRHDLAPWAWFSEIQAAGFTAVSLFFVLSGYVLAHANLGKIADGTAGRRVFFVRRFARIYPALILALIWCVALTFRPEGPGLGAESASEYLLRFTASAFLVESWVGIKEINIPAWSLSCEAFFYLCFPLIAARVVRLGERGLVRLGVLCVLVSLSVSTLAHVYLSKLGLPTDRESAGLVFRLARWHPLSRLPEFVFGIVVYRYVSRSVRYTRLSQWATPAFVVSAITILLVLANSSVIPHIVLHNSLLLPFFAALICSLAAGGGGVIQTLLSSRAMVALGNASFALYIFQLPALATFHPLLRLLGVESHAVASVISRILLVISSLLLFRFYEEPARTWLTRTLLRHKRQTRDSVDRRAS